jgi:hypothetical protein
MLKSKGLPPRLRVAIPVVVLSAPRTPRRANRIEIRISRFLEGAIFAVTSLSVTFGRKLGENAAQEKMEVNDASTMKFQSGTRVTRGRHEPFRKDHRLTEPRAEHHAVRFSNPSSAMKQAIEGIWRITDLS